ncbi:MAG: N-acetyltransferase family protein [Halanaeroarchaeum sp.]
MEFEIRSIRDRSDVRGVVIAHARAWRAAYDELLPAAALDSVSVDPDPAEVDDWAATLEAASDGVFVAVDPDDRVRGFVELRWAPLETKAFVGENEAGLRAIYVDPAAWGQGAGSALLARGLDAVPASIEAVRLEVFSANERAIGFYEARGFTRTGTGEYEVAGDSYPTAIYTRPL